MELVIVCSIVSVPASVMLDWATVNCVPLKLPETWAVNTSCPEYVHAVLYPGLDSVKFTVTVSVKEKVPASVPVRFNS